MKIELHSDEAAAQEQRLGNKVSHSSWKHQTHTS